MKKIFKNSIGRRKFLEKSLLGTSAVVSGTLFPNILNAEPSKTFSKFVSSSDSFKEGIFPFYKFVYDFNIGEYIPKDQGGKFVQMELIGAEHDDKIVEILKDGLIEKNLGTPPDWGRLEKTELEKSVWFNRFYYLPSFARLYYLDKNIEHINFMLQVIKNWIKENPVEGPSKSRYNWFDMQVAWRSINLSWCYYLSKDALTDIDKEVIYNLQGEHAKILIKDFGKKELNEFNHQSHGALAILYLAILFPSLPEASELLRTGLKIINHHVDNAFYNDGGNIEQMFGYYPFMTSVFRDVYLLCRANNVGELKSILPLLRKMYVYLNAIAQPDNTVPPINDSYEETVSFILPTLEGIIGYDNLPEEPHTTCFNDSQFGVIRSEINAENSWYINLNPAKLIGSHAHAGRLAFNLWYNKKPILVDSGCCNYDNPLLVEWYRTSKAHNTVIIDGKSDFLTSQNEVQWVSKRYTNNIIKHFIVKPEYKFCRMVSPETDQTNSGVKWTRDVILVKDDYLVIHDYFETDKYHNYETIFRFADLEVVESDFPNRLLVKSINDLILIPAIKNGESKLKSDFFGSHSKNIKTPTAIYKFEQNGNAHASYLIKGVSNIEDLRYINIEQKVDNSYCTLEVSNENKELIRLEISNKDDSEKDIIVLTN